MARRPVVNYLLLAANILLFFFGYSGIGAHADQIDSWLLHPDRPELHQFFTSVFLHAGWMHLIGNMIFLWVFGNAINDRLGHVGYLAFYLAGGVLACVGYLALGATAPVLGASGAISAVTGAYLVLFPRARVTLLLWFYIIASFEVSSLFFLLFQLLHNLYESFVAGGLAGGGGVAYNAHLTGYAFGILTAGVLLATRVLPRDAFDLLSLIRTARRRARYHRMVAQGYDPFMGGDPGERLRRGDTGRKVPSRVVATATRDGASSRELDLRRQIAERIRLHDLPAAAQQYAELLRVAPDAVLSKQNQLDVANQLMAAHEYERAAQAYERFLQHYESYEHVGDIYLMLGLIYGRYVVDYDRAETLLQRALETVREPRKSEMARAELDNVRRQRGV